MTRLGVKYCGGCNPRYDRAQALSKLKAVYEDECVFEHAAEGTDYDMLLVIGGCSSCCASYENYMTEFGVAKMRGESCIEEIILRIEKLLEEKNK